MRIIKKLKKIIDKILNKINYHHKNSFKKKDYNSFIEGILISEILKNKKIQIIQVGANDGVKGDPLRNFVTKYSDFIKLLAIEPQEVAFENLKKNYLGYKNIFFSNKAVGNGYEKNFYFFNKNYSDLNNTNDTFDRHSSFEKSHLIKRISQKDIKEKEFDRYIGVLKIKTYKLDEILHEFKNDFSQPTFLQIDAEGYDDEVIINSSVENFKFKNLSEERLKILNIFLTKNGYEIIRWNKSDEIACKFN